MSAVTDLLDQLSAGSKTVDEVADAFRVHQWPVTREPTLDAAEGFRRDIEDPEEPVEGSFFEVALARSMGTITMDQYEVLAEAAAEGMRGAPEGEEAAALAEASVAQAATEPPAGGVDPDEDETQLFGA